MCDKDSMSVQCEPVQCPSIENPTCGEPGQQLVNKTDGCCSTQSCGQLQCLRKCDSVTLMVVKSVSDKASPTKLSYWFGLELFINTICILTSYVLGTLAGQVWLLAISNY